MARFTIICGNNPSQTLCGSVKKNGPFVRENTGSEQTSSSVRINQSIYLSILSINLPIYQSISQPISQSVNQTPIDLSVSITQCIILSVKLSVYQPINPSLNQSTYLSIYLSIYLSFFLSLYVCICVCVDHLHRCKTSFGRSCFSCFYIMFAGGQSHVCS